MLGGIVKMYFMCTYTYVIFFIIRCIFYVSIAWKLWLSVGFDPFGGVSMVFHLLSVEVSVWCELMMKISQCRLFSEFANSSILSLSIMVVIKNKMYK